VNIQDVEQLEDSFRADDEFLDELFRCLQANDGGHPVAVTRTAEARVLSG
jgi:hypothetical protein